MCIDIDKDIENFSRPSPEKTRETRHESLVGTELLLLWLNCQDGAWVFHGPWETIGNHGKTIGKP